jgi:hypothetical protein
MAWDGLGGTADLFNYSGNEVDALAAKQDALYYAVLDNNTNLLLSFQGDVGGNSIYAISPGGDVSLWASSDTIMTPATMGGTRIEPFDLNSLEVWGPELVRDADNYSYANDPAFGCSIFQLGSGCLLTNDELSQAIGRPDLANVIDLDGLMTSGNDILFSIQPVDGYDGGEIWRYIIGSGPGTATYLEFGGQIWDTDFKVQDFFTAQGYSIGTENIDAIEAVSTPGPLPVLGTAVLFGSVKRLRKLSATLKASART